MGGNALAEFGARRFDKKEYLLLKQEVLEKLYSLGGYHGWVEIPSYRCKESFGDLDVLCTNIDNEVFDRVLEIFDNPHRYRNSGTLSILYKDLQVDLISTLPEDYHSSLVYFSYNDLGNLMGKIFHKFGLKYGHTGLTLPLRDGDNKFEEILISKNHDKIFEFIGLDYAKFLIGEFYMLEDVFEFVIESPYFSKEIFSFENMNSIARIRDKKRSTYNAFLKYIEEIKITNTIVWEENKTVYLPEIFTVFPEAYDSYTKAKKQYDELVFLREKFNGNKVLGWLSEVYTNEEMPTGKEFGSFMSGLRNGQGIDDFNNWIKNSTEEEIKRGVIDSYRSWV